MYSNKYNWSISYSVVLPVTASTLWSIISLPSNLELFHPFCKKNITIKWPGENAVDEIHYYNGDIYKRKFVTWINNIGYDLIIAKDRQPQSFVRWRIEDLNQDCKLTIIIFPYIFNMNSKLFDFFPFFLIVKPKLYNYLKNIGQGLRYYINTNRKVSQNQFSNHHWFSN